MSFSNKKQKRSSKFHMKLWDIHQQDIGSVEKVQCNKMSLNENDYIVIHDLLLI